ncbi:P-type conjugative transfer protein TrbJ [Paremcibacter congregatus]|uniref:P-type conjugative transfer protein TrbJ n=1 Tax=Paremcibacter congregatus TaxID=2043170 RepID=UPI0030ED2106|tara:strand:+ start:8113 stop:8841 length:729 start_codon:yes stop_codon:yes gene_type:complete
MKSLKKPLFSAIFMLATVLLPAQQAHALLGFGIVFDPTNYGQNILTAANTLRQLNNQIVQLQNEARMLVNQTRNLTNLPTSISGDLQSSLARMDGLIRSARNVSYQITAIDAHYQRLYPQRYAAATTSSQIFQDGQEAWNVARAGFQHSMQVQAAVVEQVRSDSAILDRLVSKSQSAVGNLQVTQAGNQLAALNAKQTMQLQTLLAASTRAESLDRTATLAAREQARARFQNFLGDRQAYTP